MCYACVCACCQTRVVSVHGVGAQCICVQPGSVCVCCVCAMHVCYVCAMCVCVLCMYVCYVCLCELCVCMHGVDAQHICMRHGSVCVCVHVCAMRMCTCWWTRAVYVHGVGTQHLCVRCGSVCVCYACAPVCGHLLFVCTV